jgi:hypothetical protein
MFRGIDPVGLDRLANTLDTQTGSVRHRTRVALDLLNRNGMNAAAATVGALAGHIENWGAETSATLRWRAATIQTDAGLDILGLTRARFAAQALFSVDNVDEAYRRWIEQVQASERRVGEAITNISDWLDQSWTDWDVTNGDLHNIWSTLQNLAKGELDQVLAELSPRQLERWIEEMGNAINGFSQDEKREVFSLLAANSSGESLSKIHNAILTGGGSEEATDFGLAVRAHAPDQAIVDFVTYAMDLDLTHVEYSGVAPALSAAGIGDSSAVDRMLHAILSRETALQLIAVDSLVTMHAVGDDAPSHLNPLNSLITAIARGSDPQLKAVAFAAMAEMATDADNQLRELLGSRHHIVDTTTTDIIGTRDHDNTASRLLRSAELELLAAATAILVSDANGVVEQLATGLDPDGSLLASYLYGLVDNEGIGQLGQFVDNLRGGDVVDPVAFSAPGIDPGYQYPHAQNLGFVAGNLRNALELYADAEKNDIDWIGRGAHLATAAVGLAYSKVLEGMSLVGAGIEGVAEWLTTDYWASRTKEEIEEHLAQLIETIETGMQPQPIPDAVTPNLGEALQAWDDRYDLIKER